MYTVITVILNANGFAIGSAVSLRESERQSKFRHGSIIHQVFLILVVSCYSYQKKRDECLSNSVLVNTLDTHFSTRLCHEVCIQVVEQLIRDDRQV